MKKPYKEIINYIYFFLLVAFVTTCTIVLFMDIFGIGHRVGVHIHQKGGLGLNVWNIQRGSGRGQKQPGQAGAEQKNR